MGRSIGIDFGADYAVMAAWQNGKCESVRMIPSMAGTFKGNCQVGPEAVKHWPDAPGDTIYDIRSLLGRSIADGEIQSIRNRHPYEIVPSSSGNG